MTNYDDVRTFHVKFDLPHPERPAPVTRERAAERANFMLEELLEFADAAGLILFSDGAGRVVFEPLSLADQDFPPQADALIDIVYVAMGTAVQMGLPWQRLWDDVQRANMAKVRGASDRSYIDVIKPDGWEGPRTEKILKEAGRKGTTVPPDPTDVGPWYLEHDEGAGGTWFWSPERQAWADGMYHTTPSEMAALGWRVAPDPRTPPIGRVW
jgi:predicted HAD superfamily Cof-like phosphohydrolase